MSWVSFGVAVSSASGSALVDELKAMGGEYLVSVSRSSKRNYWILPGDKEMDAQSALRRLEKNHASVDLAVSFHWDQTLVDELKAMGAKYLVSGPRSNRRKFWILPTDRENDARAAALRLLGTDGRVTDFVDVVLVVEPGARVVSSEWYLSFAYLPLLRTRGTADAKAEPFDDVELISGQALCEG